MGISPVYAKSFTGTAPLKVNFIVDASSTNDNGYITKYEWDMDGDGTYETNTFHKNWINYIFLFGTHVVGIKITDSFGEFNFYNYSVIALKPTPPTISMYVDMCSVCSTNGTQ